MHPVKRTPRLRLAAFATAFFILAQGCSFIFVRPPPSHPTDEEPSCPESRAAPIADSIVTGAALALSLLLLGASCGDCEGPTPAGALVLAPVVLGMGASAVHGFRATSR